MAARGGVAPPASPSLSLFGLPPDFFDSCRLLSDPREIPAPQPHAPYPPPVPPLLPPEPPSGDGNGELKAAGGAGGGRATSLWTCHTCDLEFESLQDQRFHFKSDLHRLNVKLHVSGKGAVKEEDFDELGDESLSKQFDVSSISGSEDDSDSSLSSIKTLGQGREPAKQKIYIRLQSGATVSLWRCLPLDDSEVLSFENNKLDSKEKVQCMLYVSEYDLIKRLNYLAQEPRDKTCLRIVLLACGGHFAGCVFDGNSTIAHKTFHRYVVRAKAGKKQSAKDATGKTANSAGSNLRRYNEAALKKEIHELLVTWRPYFDVSSCIFIYAPSKNHQLLFDGEKPALNCQDYVVRHIPMTVRRPTLKEAKRIYNLLTHLVYEANEDRYSTVLGDPTLCAEEKGVSQEAREEFPTRNPESNEKKNSTACLHPESSGSDRLAPDNGAVTSVVKEGTPLHEAAKSGDAQQTLELLEQGLDPCVKDVRGRTPYMLASEKEVRNTFRRFMALNLDKWDWHAANVPSPLTKEMEESQTAKQAEKDAKRKAKAKELKKLRKAKEKAKAQATVHQNASSIVTESKREHPAMVSTMRAPTGGAPISVEEELKRTLAAEREKRAAAAERRIATLRASATDATAASASSSDSRSGASTTSSQSSGGMSGGGNLCSCCQASLAGKVPFHRYHYKYCSTSCMHVHREMLEDG